VELTECEDAAARYRKEFDWPCTAVGHAVWTLAGQAVDAVDIPEDSGERAMSTLHGQGRPHSVIMVPGDHVLLRFLVQPRVTTPHGLVRELAGRGGRYLNHATVIELPPTRVAAGELRWVRGPMSSLPTLSHVVAAVLRDDQKSSDR
jgi:hypothetical protein